MWDYSDTLVSYIRHTFITCDDTGICEAALRLPAPNSEKPGTIRVFHDDDDDNHQGTSSATTNGGRRYDEDDVHDGSTSTSAEHSPDIHADVGHRRRSETSKRLETLKQQRIAQGKIKTVQWKEPSAINTTSDQTSTAAAAATGTTTSMATTTPLRRVILSNGTTTDSSSSTTSADNNNVAIFTKIDYDDLKMNAESARSRRSAVSKLVQACPDLPVNPFQEFMRFDGNASIGPSSKTIRVFPLMASNAYNRSKALDVCVTSSAKVADLIGLICFHYTSRNLTPKLSTDTTRYALHVAEDTGELDSDLPPRSPHENVSRFHFPYLALVDRGDATSSSSMDGQSGTGRKYFVIVHVSTGDKYKLELDTLETPLKNVRDLALAMRSKEMKMKKGLEYNIEKLNDPNVTLPLDATVSSSGTTEFMLVRAFSARGDLTPQTPVASQPIDFTLPPPAFTLTATGQPSSHYFTVAMIRKFKRDAKVQLTISRDRLEISPVRNEERKLSTASAAKFIRSFQRHHHQPQQPNPAGLDESTSAGTSAGQDGHQHHHHRKTVNYALNQIGGAEIQEDKGGRKAFRIVHRHQTNNAASGQHHGSAGASSSAITTSAGTEWKSHQFEADSSIVDEIVRTINRYLDIARGDVRQDFLRRTPRKSSFFKRIQLGDLSFGETAAAATGISGTTPQN